jgi:hypothetical protein
MRATHAQSDAHEAFGVQIVEHSGRERGPAFNGIGDAQEYTYWNMSLAVHKLGGKDVRAAYAWVNAI